MEFFLNAVTLFVDPIAAIMLMFILFSERNRLFAPIGYRIGLAVSISGLIGQLAWSGVVIFLGEDKTINSMPWWIGKDLGYFIFALTYVLRHIKNDRDYEKIREHAENRIRIRELQKLESRGEEG